MEKQNDYIWEQLKSVPEKAQKKITGGRLKGMTDIKPQWRLNRLTEVFGCIGIGWYYEVTKQWIVNPEIETNEQSAFVNINLYVKIDGEWSKPIFGTGGSSFVAKEKYGLHLSDECYKMALTDAISVASKQLGLASDVYMGYSDSKYVGDKADPKNNIPVKWLTESQFKSTKKQDDDYIKKALEYYDGKTIHNDNGNEFKASMKKAYKEELKQILIENQKI